MVVALENKLGELGSYLGAVTGIQWFNGLGESVSMVTGIIFIVCVLAFRKGIVGSLGQRLGEGKTVHACLMLFSWPPAFLGRAIGGGWFWGCGTAVRCCA